MVTVVRTQNPQHAAAEDGAVIVIDSKGRKLKISEPSILQESRLMRILEDAANNSNYVMGYVLPTAMVVEIDNDPIPFPINMALIEASMQRLGREGISAVMAHIIAQAEKQKESADALKKSAALPSSETPAGS
jgi:hypothetical protein